MAANTGCPDTSVIGRARRYLTAEEEAKLADTWKSYALTSGHSIAFPNSTRNASWPRRLTGNRLRSDT